MFKSLFLVVGLMFALVGVAVATPVTMVGGVIFVGVPGAATTPVVVNYNTEHNNQADCDAAIAAIDIEEFVPYGNVAHGGKSEGDIKKYVFLKCVPTKNSTPVNNIYITVPPVEPTPAP